MPKTLPRRAALALPWLAAIPATVRAQAPEWRPAGPVRIVVPTTPAGLMDVAGRLLAAHLQQRWGQPVVVDNRAGAGGVLGTQEMLRAPADGHTLLIGNTGSQAIAYSLVKNLSYGPGDLLPVSGIFQGPNVLVLNRDVPANSVPEFIALLKANPARYHFGTPGVGLTPHISGVWFSQLAQVQVTAVHYRGSALAATDLLNGTVHFMFDALANAIESVRAGRVKALAVTSAERHALLPELPTMRETAPALAPYVMTGWVGAFLRAGTPAPAVARLNADVGALLAHPVTRDRLQAMGGRADAGTPEAYEAFVRAEIEKFGRIIRSAGIEADGG
jgi:tripartite-type tricarboxylate transporter receptor subunit TctC